jgi:hypothetical protein
MCFPHHSQHTSGAAMCTCQPRQANPELSQPAQNSAPLLAPDVLICSVGTELFYRDPAGDYVPDVEWVALLDQGWNRDAAQRVAASLPQLQPQVATEQRRHKLSYHLKRGSSLAEDEAVRLTGPLQARNACSRGAARLCWECSVQSPVAWAVCPADMHGWHRACPGGQVWPVVWSVIYRFLNPGRHGGSLLKWPQPAPWARSSATPGAARQMPKAWPAALTVLPCMLSAT